MKSKKSIRKIKKTQSTSSIYKEFEIDSDNINNSREGFSIIKLNEILLEMPYESPLLCPDYFSILFVKKGKGKWITSKKSYILKPNTISFSNIYNERLCSYENVDEIYKIIFDEHFIKKYISRNVYDEFPFLLTENLNPRVVSNEFYNIVEELYIQIYYEYNKEQKNYKIIAYLLGALLHRFKDFFWMNNGSSEKDNSRMIKSFKKLLENHYANLLNEIDNKIYNVKDFAEQLGYHPVYFSRMIKIKTGKTVLEWIMNKKISQAKFLLKDDENSSIKEIAYKLGFSAPSHFSSYFKKHTNLSPSEFRKVR